ncbi:disulfide bond formation protein B [Alphaproteobacteria bacterium]|nr:disulfide bond formation protein B [Alphaproteobacteria bacterium]
MNKIPFRTKALIISALSFLILMTALIMEHFFDVPVCRMCVFERYPYILSTLLGGVFFFWAEKSFVQRWASHLLTIVFLIGLGLSLYHVALEYRWIDLPVFCKGSSSLLGLDTLESLRAHILSQNKIIPCNIVPLRILFLSLAEWNAISSLLLLTGSWTLLKKK